MVLNSDTFPDGYVYFYRSLSEEDIGQNQSVEKQFQSVETQTDHSENSLTINTWSETASERRILYETSREIRNIYCNNNDRPPTCQEFKLFSYKRRNYKIDLKRNCSEKYNTLV